MLITNVINFRKYYAKYQGKGKTNTLNKVYVDGDLLRWAIWGSKDSE